MDDVDVNDGAGESVHHERCSHLALGHAAVLSRRKLGGCALLILRQPTSDAGERRATIIVNHLAQSPPPAATATVNNACCAEACGWGAEGNRHPGSETALQLGSTIYPYLKQCTDTSVWLSVCFVSLDNLHPESGDRYGAAVCSLQSASHRLAHSSAVISHHATQRDTGRAQTSPGPAQLVGLAGRYWRLTAGPGSTFYLSVV